MPAKNPMPAPRPMTIQPAPKAPDINSVRPAEPVMFIPPVAEPVADVMLIPLIPFIRLIPLIPLISLDMVIEVLMDMPLIPEVIEEPLVATTAAAVGSLSHIIVTTSAADGFGVVSDCARARGTSARKARDLEYILVVVFDSIVDYEIAYRS